MSSNDQAATTTTTNTESSQPKTALIVLGDAMFFQPSSDVISVTILAPSAMKTALTSAQACSLETIHVVVKGVSVSTLYDPESIPILCNYLVPNGQLTAHVLVSAEGTKPVADDLEGIKTSLVLAGLRIVDETENPDGSRTLTGQKLC